MSRRDSHQPLGKTREKRGPERQQLARSTIVFVAEAESQSVPWPGLAWNSLRSMAANTNQPSPWEARVGGGLHVRGQPGLQ